MACVSAFERTRHHRIGEGEKCCIVATLVIEPFHVQSELAVEHRLATGLRNVAIPAAVNRIADRHVVGGHALRYRPGRAADAEKPSHDLLTGSDFRKCPIPTRIEIDFEGFLVGIEF